MDTVYGPAMVMTFSTPGWPPPRSQAAETSSERAERVAREAEAIARGHAEIDAGHGIGEEELEASLDALDRDPAAPLPAPALRPRR